MTSQVDSNQGSSCLEPAPLPLEQQLWSLKPVLDTARTPVDSGNLCVIRAHLTEP